MFTITVFLGFIFSSLILIKICLRYIPDISWWLILVLYSIKLAAALSITNFYVNAEEREMADVFKYYDDGLVITNSFYENPSTFLKTLVFSKSEDPLYNKYVSKLKYWGSNEKFNNVYGNRFMIRINAVLSLIFYKNYFLNVIVFTLCSFFGLLLITHTIKRYLNLKSSIVISLLCLSPSIIFWSSGILKESFLVALIGLLIFSLRRSSRASFFSIPLILWMLFTLKPALVVCLVPSIIFLILRIKFSNPLFRSIIVTILISGAFYLTGIQVLGINTIEIINLKQSEFIEIAETYEAGSAIQVLEVKNVLDLVLKSPHAFYNTMFRPALWEIKSFTYVPFAIESLLLLISPILVIFFFRPTDLNIKNIIVSFLIFVILLAIITGLTVPILGSIVRYRAPIIPFYMIIVILLVDWKKINPKIVKNLG